jgi:hypothetical protein
MESIKTIKICTPNGTFETATNGAASNRELYGKILWNNFRTGEKFYFESGTFLTVHSVLPGVNLACDEITVWPEIIKLVQCISWATPVERSLNTNFGVFNHALTALTIEEIALYKKHVLGIDVYKDKAKVFFRHFFGFGVGCTEIILIGEIPASQSFLTI